MSMERFPPPSPPTAARWWLRFVLRKASHEVIAGDLEEEFATEIVPRLGTTKARRWFWRQAILSVLACLRPPSSPPQELLRRGDHPMDIFLQNLRFGLRMLRKSPTFTLAAVLTLSLGIGASIAIFSAVHSFLLKPLPYAEPEELVFALGWDEERGRMRFSLSFADFVDLRARTETFEDLAGYRYWSANLTGGEHPERVQAYQMTSNAFDLLGVEPSFGRTFAVQEGGAGGDKVVVLSHALWQRRFAAAEGILGQEILLDGTPHTVVGIMPPHFAFPLMNFKGELWVPLTDDPQTVRANGGGSAAVVVVGRLRDAAALAQAQAELSKEMSLLAEEFPETNAGIGVRVFQIHEMLTRDFRPALWALMVAVGLVLLLVCANVANLLLGRAVERRRELAVRNALGAGTGRLVGQMLTESWLLAFFGGALGVAVAYGMLRVLRASLPSMVYKVMPTYGALELDFMALGFALVAVLVTGTVCGLGPALRAARSDLRGELGEGGPAGSPGARRARWTLAVGQVGLSSMLLVSTVFLARSVQNLLQVDTGFEEQGVLALSVSLAGERYAEAEAVRQFFDQVEQRVGGLPGVEAVGWVNTLPFSTSESWRSFAFEGRPESEPGKEPRARYRVASPGYFDALGIKRLRGRVLAPEDRANSVPVALVDRTFVERFLPEGEALGLRVRVGPTATWHEIVGVVESVRHTQLTEGEEPSIYVPLEQQPRMKMTLALRSTSPPLTLVDSIRREVQAVDPGQPIFQITTLESLVAESHLAQTAAMLLMAVFAGFALALTALGLYGVLAYMVSQGTREIGLRMALGAGFSQVLSGVLREALGMVVAGTVLGLAGAWGVSKLFTSLLYGLTSENLGTYLLALPFLALVAFLACVVPALRAVRIDPVVALRAE